MSDSANEDEAILKVAGQLCVSLGVSTVPSRVEWVERFGGGGRGGSGRVPDLDECSVNGKFIELSAAMRGKLDPEEWRPLLASSLIYDSQMGSRVRRHNEKWFLVGLVPLSLLLFWVYLLTVQDQLPYLIPILALFGMLGLFAIVVYLSFPFTKRLFLLADGRAADLVGKEQFSRVLKKIASLQGDDVTDPRYGKQKERFRFKPSLSHRITNLAGDEFGQSA